MRKHKQIKKFSQQYVIQDLVTNHYSQFAYKIIEKSGMKIQEQVIKKMIENQYSLRKIQDQLLLFRTKNLATKTQQLTFMKTRDDFQQQKLQSFILNQLEKLRSQKNKLQFLQKIVKSQKILSPYACSGICHYIKFTFDTKQTKLQQVIEALDRNNAITFCQPPANLQRQAFKKVNQKLKGQNNKNNK